MIHSRRKDGREILNFCERYNQFENRKCLVAVPTNYPVLSEEDLAAAGINLVIYANQLLRASYTAMQKAALSILEHGRALEADREYISALELISLIDGN
jgi:PEP phosphonomutase and related enzymes